MAEIATLLTQLRDWDKQDAAAKKLAKLPLETKRKELYPELLRQVATGLDPAKPESDAFMLFDFLTSELDTEPDLAPRLFAMMKGTPPAKGPNAQLLNYFGGFVIASRDRRGLDHLGRAPERSILACDAADRVDSLLEVMAEQDPKHFFDGVTAAFYAGKRARTVLWDLYNRTPSVQPHRKVIAAAIVLMRDPLDADWVKGFPNDAAFGDSKRLYRAHFAQDEGAHRRDRQDHEEHGEADQLRPARRTLHVPGRRGTRGGGARRHRAREARHRRRPARIRQRAPRDLPATRPRGRGARRDSGRPRGARQGRREHPAQHAPRPRAQGHGRGSTSEATGEEEAGRPLPPRRGEQRRRRHRPGDPREPRRRRAPPRARRSAHGARRPAWRVHPDPGRARSTHRWRKRILTEHEPSRHGERGHLRMARPRRLRHERRPEPRRAHRAGGRALQEAPQTLAPPVRAAIRTFSWRRGFLCQVNAPAQAFLDGAEGLLAAHPVAVELEKLDKAAYERMPSAALHLLRSLRATGVPQKQVSAFLGENLGGLERLTLGGTKLGDAGVARLASESHLRSLRRLQLGGSELTDAGVRAIAESPLFDKLEKLNLAANQITDAGVRALVESKHLPRLRLVELGRPDGWPQPTYDLELLSALADRLDRAPRA